MSGKYLAALDIGTNSFHLIIAQVTKDSDIKIVARKREVLRLAAGNWKEDKVISEEEIQKSVQTLMEFKKTAESYNAEIKAVATSTIRESRNRDHFVKEIFKHTGIRIEPIDGSEEARMIFDGAVKALKLDDEDVFCFDIGGGSTELILRLNKEIVFSESLKLGAVRLSKMFFPDYLIMHDRISECETYILQTLHDTPGLCYDFNVPLNIGTSGTVQSAVHLLYSIQKKISPDKLNGLVLSHDDFMRVFSEVMSRKTPSERKTIKGMEAKRADIIPAGLLILKSIFESFHIPGLVYSEFALREGLILSQI